MHHSSYPATDVPEMGKGGDGTSPKGGGGDKTYLSYSFLYI